MKQIFNIKELQNGDIIFFRNEKLGVYISHFNSVVLSSGGYINLDERKTWLSLATSDYDIVRVCRPQKVYQCILSSGANNGEVVYDEANVETMTLEEVCRALGKQIRIVKTEE